MNHQGHGLALAHTIFNAPNAVTFATTEATPHKGHAGLTSPLYPEGMGETYDVVDFEVSPPDEPNPTLVSHEGFFTDVPGFENLAEGVSAKMLGSLALARQGSYFYWGYSVDPERLTAPAEDVLENVIRYMRTKRGAATVPFVCKTRRTLWTYLRLFEESGYMRGMEEHFLGTVQENSRRGYVPTPEGLAAWLDENLDYVFSGKDESHTSDTRYKTVFEVDFDARVLGTPNGERESLEVWLRAAAGDSADGRVTGTRLLKRYVHPSIAPEDWSQPFEWYGRMRGEIVFVESAGFWWMADPTR